MAKLQVFMHLIGRVSPNFSFDRKWISSINSIYQFSTHVDVMGYLQVREQEREKRKQCGKPNQMHDRMKTKIFCGYTLM